jgi:hypothetical protein
LYSSPICNARTRAYLAEVCPETFCNSTIKKAIDNSMVHGWTRKHIGDIWISNESERVAAIVEWWVLFHGAGYQHKDFSRADHMNKARKRTD